MKRTYRFVAPIGTIQLAIADGTIELPVVPGILKHPSPEQLPSILSQPEAARKYTREALRKAPWQVLREFPADWLRACLMDTDLPEGRLRALQFLLPSKNVEGR